MTSLSYDDQLWWLAGIRGRRLFAALPLEGMSVQERTLHDLMTMGTFDWAGIHRPMDSTTRSMRYAAALVDCQVQVLRDEQEAKQHKVLLPSAHFLVSRLTEEV